MDVRKGKNKERSRNISSPDGFMIKKKTDSNSAMLSGSILSTYLRFSLPWTFSMLIAGSATIVDGLFIGRFVGSSALASINIIVPVFSLLGGLGIMLAAGGSAIIGNYLGKGQIPEASAALVKTILAVITISLAFSIGVWASMGILPGLLGANSELQPYCEDYLVALLPFLASFPVSYALSYFVRVDGRPVLASMGFVLAGAFNVIFDALFIVHMQMGICGAALATGIAYTLASLMFCTHFFSAKCTYAWPKSLGSWHEPLSAAWNGLSEFVNETSAGIVIFLFNRILIHHMGVPGVAAYTAAGYVMMLGALLNYGFADSLTPIISVNNGARKLMRMRAFLYFAAAIIIGIGISLTIVIGLWPKAISSLFLPEDRDGQLIAVRFLDAMKWQFPFMAMNMLLTAYFTGRLWAASSFTVAVSRSLVLPVLLVMLLPFAFGIGTIYYITPVTEIFTLFVAIALYASGLKKA